MEAYGVVRSYRIREAVRAQAPKSVVAIDRKGYGREHDRRQRKGAVLVMAKRGAPEDLADYGVPRYEFRRCCNRAE